MSRLVYNNDYLSTSRAFGMKEFSEALEKAMERESKFTKKESFAPSGLGYSGSCPRYWYYAFNGEVFEYNTTAAAVANMDAGTDSGQRLAKLLDKAGILIDTEVEVNTIGHDTYPPVRGYIDAVVEWQGQEVVVEIKTCKSSTWTHRATKNTVPEYQMIQLLIYMYVTGRERGFFLTENKDTHEIFILPVKMNEANKALVESVFEWMHKVKSNNELPERPFTKSSLPCKGCPVSKVCWDGYKRGSVNGEDPNPGTVKIEVLNLSK